MRFKVLIFFFVLSVSSAGQEVRIIDGSEGLNNPTVYDVVQDPWGFTWLGTRDGLYRYNEGKATTFSFLDSTTARRSNNVQSLLVTQDSLLMIGLQLGGIVSVDLKTLQPRSDLSCPQLPLSSSIISLYETSNGTLWAGTNGNGTYFLEKGSGEWTPLRGKIHGNEIAFCFDFAQQGDTLWMATSGSSLLYVLQSSNTIYSTLTDATVSSYRKSVDVRGGKVAFGVEDQGLFLFESEQGLFKRVQNLEGVWPRDVLFQEDALWVSTDGEGLYKLQENGTHHYSKYHSQQGLASDQFYGIYPIEDELWLGTYNAGITVISENERTVTTLNFENQSGGTGINSAISLYGDQSLWVGYDGDGLASYPFDANELPQAYSMDYLPKVVTSLERYQGDLWVGSLSEGLFVIDEKGRLKHRYLASSGISNGLVNSNIWSMEKSWGDSLWIGTLSGLQFWNGTSFESPFTSPWRVGRNIMDLEFTGSTLWVGSEFSGLFGLDKEGNIESIPLDNSVLDLASYQDHLLIGTEGAGILSYHQGRLDTVLQNSDYLNCYAIAANDRFIFATTSSGLLRISFTGKDWDAELVKEIDELHIGLPNRKSLVLQDLMLYVGGTQGVAAVNTDGISSKNVPDILLTGAFADNQRQNITLVKNNESSLQPISFLPGTKSLRFNFELMSTTPQRGITCSYRLKNKGEAWLPISSGARVVEMSSLDPGNYDIEIKAQRSNNQTKTLSFSFSVEAYFWQQFWFKALLFLSISFFIGFVVFFYQDRKFRLTRLKLVETERELLKVKAAELEVKTEKQKTELSFQLLKTSSRLELLQSFKDRLVQESQKKGRSAEVLQFLQGMTRELNRELQSENYWDHFERNYRELHESFSANLKEQYPDLTKGEVRLSYLLRQKMSNKEVANVLNVSPAAVEKAKYRLKKKLNLQKENSLDEFIQKL